MKKLINLMLVLVMALSIPITAQAAKNDVNQKFVSKTEGVENLVFGMEYLRVSQSGHDNFACDVVGKDGSREWFYAPCTLVVKKVYDKPKCHALFLESKEKVRLADGSTSKIVLQIVHIEDLSGYRVSQVFPQGMPICRESNHGISTGVHLHISVAKGSYTDPGWVKLKNGSLGSESWGLENAISLDKAFFISPKATTILKPGKYDWKELVDYKVEKAPVLMKVTSVNGSGTTPAHNYPEGCAKVVERFRNGDLLWATHKATNQYGHEFYKINGGWVYSEYLTIQKKETANITLAGMNLKEGSFYRLTNKASGENIQFSGKTIQMASGTKNTAFKLDEDSGWYLLRGKADNKLVLNALADEPIDKTKVSLYSKQKADPTQGWILEKAGASSIVRLAHNPHLVLTQVNSGVQVRKYTPNNTSQLWKLSRV